VYNEERRLAKSDQKQRVVKSEKKKVEQPVSECREIKATTKGIKETTKRN
jgi:hypothetical protein